MFFICICRKCKRHAGFLDGSEGNRLVNRGEFFYNRLRLVYFEKGWQHGYSVNGIFPGSEWLYI